MTCVSATTDLARRQRNVLLPRALLWLALSFCVSSCLNGSRYRVDEDGGNQQTAPITSPETCAGCHPRQYAEWSSSMMAYGAMSPSFNALEAVGNRITHGSLSTGGSNANFCMECHSPGSVAFESLPTFEEKAGKPSRDFLSETGQRGVSCDICHQTTHPDLNGSLMGDGIANSAFVMTAGAPKQGPYGGSTSNAFHGTEKSDYLQSSEFCGSCHDVRITSTDAITQEPFQRLENAFSEWQASPYATTDNPYGKVITCQGCHMSAYPYAEPGVYFEDYVTRFTTLPKRRVTTHYFTGVDIALIPFPGQYDTGLDSHGTPIGQNQRRIDLLKAACDLELQAPNQLSGETLSISVDITNVGAGHGVPTGFSQEREMWIEVSITDATGRLLYESGFLRDTAHPETLEFTPDGSLDDEDLQDILVFTDPTTFAERIEHGPDFNERPLANRGLKRFNNEFLRRTDHGFEETFLPFFSEAIDNHHAIPPFETVRTPYDITIPSDAVGPLKIRTRLLFRAFPPRFLRVLGQARPDLVTEEMIDRNRIIEMDAQEATVDLP